MIQNQKVMPRSAATEILHAMSNENRYRLISILNTKDEVSVGELNAQVDLSQSALSQHLAVFRRAGMVSTRRASQIIYYSLTSALAKDILRLIEVEYGSSD